MAETFDQWYRRNLPEVVYFTSTEFLVKGSEHSDPSKDGYRLNTDPPVDLWPNVIPLARLLQTLRVRLGAPINLHSVYRSPRYNAAVDGASASLHMQFKAADFSVLGNGRPVDWAATLAAMRAEGQFNGGIFLYRTFVHVDVRGHNVGSNDWGNGRVLGTSTKPPPRPTPQPTPRPQPSPSPSQPSDGRNYAVVAIIALIGFAAFVLLELPAKIGRGIKALFNKIRGKGI